MEFKVIKINQEYRNVVVSHKALIEEELEQQKKEIISKLEKGQVLEGTVKNITSYGVFIDLGGVDGLIHISQIADKKVENVKDILSVGDEVDVKIIEIDTESKRISISMRALIENADEAEDAPAEDAE